MEEYLQYVNALRSQMNDVENQAAHASMEEHTLLATINAMENDLNSGFTSSSSNEIRAEKKQLDEDLGKMSISEAQMRSQIQEKQKKLASLELDSSTLTQGNKDEEELIGKLESEKCKLNDITRMKNKLITKNTKMQQSIDELLSRVNETMPELMKMDMKNLEEEYNGFLSDKAGEMDYIQSLVKQIKKLKAVADSVKCICGSEYKVGSNE
ncbi:hypothetical protein LINGRAHAP2_LOCUS16777 [Linum grandiflorum]